MGRFIIYGLLDPRPERYGELRYIGKSVTGLTRPKKHLLVTCLDKKTHLSRWRNKLHQLGLLVSIEIVVLEECDGPVLGDREIWWIAEKRREGADLVNGTDGGEGMLGRKGWKHSEESKAKVRASHLGKKASPETREKMRLAHLGRKMPDHLKEKLKNIHTGRKHSAESVEKMRAAHANVSEQAREKLSESHKGHSPTEETLAKLSESHKAENLSVVSRSNLSNGQQRRRARERAEKRNSDDKK